MGRVKFLIFYLLGGVAALALQILVGPSSKVPTLGASGAIAAVLGGYIVLFPRARVVTVIFIIFFFTILELPALLVLGLWFLQQALFGYFDLASLGRGRRRRVLRPRRRLRLRAARGPQLRQPQTGRRARPSRARAQMPARSCCGCCCSCSAAPARTYLLATPPTRRRPTRRRRPPRCRTPRRRRWPAAGRRPRRSPCGSTSPATRCGSSSSSRRAPRCCSTSTRAACCTGATRRACCRSPA